MVAGRVNDLQAIASNIKATFQAGISRLENSHLQSAKLLQRELQFQSDNIVQAIEHGSADIVSSLQNACDYLGGQLCEIRWLIERQTEVSRQILQVLLNALDNTSRQYWEQGVKCYETREYDMAKERFSRALEANRTNYFAYQYLGFIAVHEDSPKETIRKFQLARNFADDGYHRALALSHLARGHYAAGDLSTATESAIEATEAAPEHAKFWYECAVFQVRRGDPEAIACLRRSITADWAYWSIAASDENLNSIRQQVYQLLDQMRGEQGAIARRSIDQLSITMHLLKSLRIDTELSEYRAKLAECEALYEEGTVFSYRKVVQPAEECIKGSLQVGIRVLDERISKNDAAREEAKQRQQQQVAEVAKRIAAVESKAWQRERSYKLGWFRGFLFVLSPIAGFVSCGIDAANNRSGNDAEGSAFVVMAIGFAVAMLWNPVMRSITAVMPAEYIRAQIPELQRELERVKIDSEVQLAKQTAALDSELRNIRQQREQCQLSLKG